MFRKLWSDDAGVVSLEYLILSTVVGIGMAVGTSAVSGALNAEYTELANSILVLNQGHYIMGQGVFNPSNSIFDFGQSGGSHATDTTDSIIYYHTVDTAHLTPDVQTVTLDEAP